MDALIASFASLFEGYDKAVGTEKGGCQRLHGVPYINAIEQHLDGSYPMGVYPMRDGQVKWGCIDIDIRTADKPSGDYATERECHEAAVNVRAVLHHLGVESWIEITRSYGRHVWVFAKDWMSARLMRRALLFACAIAGSPNREVNPKQESLPAGQLGNYVRLPYPGALGDPAKYASDVNRYIVDNHGERMGIQVFLNGARLYRTPPMVLIDLADKYREPRKPRIEVPVYTGTQDGALRQLNAKGKAVFFEGPADGDRSKGLAYLAYQCRQSGLGQGDAYAIVKDADARWGKFSTRNDCEKRLTEVVTHAWQ